MMYRLSVGQRKAQESGDLGYALSSLVVGSLEKLAFWDQGTTILEIIWRRIPICPRRKLITRGTLSPGRCCWVASY